VEPVCARRSTQPTENLFPSAAPEALARQSTALLPTSSSAARASAANAVASARQVGGEQAADDAASGECRPGGR
jgi:hypothetical protein